MKTLFGSLSLCFATLLSAQDPGFMQQSFGLSFINPAYAGSLACTRIESGYQYQPIMRDCTVQTVNVGADFFTEAGGFLVNFTHDDVDGIFITDRFDINYSYGIGIGTASDGRSIVVVQPAFQLSVFTKRVNLHEPFVMYVDPRYGFRYPGSSTPQSYSYFTADISAGILINTKHAMCGMAYYHMKEPDHEFLGGSSLPRRFTFHGAFILGNADPLSDRLSFVQSFILNEQNEESSSYVQVLAKWKGMRAGIGYSAAERATCIAGYTFRHATVSYSFTASTDDDGIPPAHEIHFSYLLNTAKWTAGLLNTQAFL